MTFTGFRVSLMAGAAALLIHAAPARADVTAAQATEVEAQVRAWLTGMVGPKIPVADRPIQLTPAGDHFDVLVPIKTQSDATSSEIKLTATARPLDGGKWSIDGVKTNMPLRFTIDMPQPPVDGKPATPPSIPVTYTVDLIGQDGQILFDPSFSTVSTSTSSIKGGTVRTAGGPMSGETRMGPGSSVTTIKPAGGDRVDVTIDGNMQDYKVSSGTMEAGPIEIGMKLVRLNGAMTGISRTRATTVVQTLTGALGAAITAPAGTPPDKIAPELGKQLLAALQDFASEFSFDESIEGLAVKASGIEALLGKAKVGFGAKSDQGVLQARMDIGAEGLKLPGLNLGPLMELVPDQIALRPFVSGVGMAELSRILQATGEKRDPAPEDIQALFSHGGIVTGLESMSLELGGATFTGQGKVTFANPSQFSGAGQITAEDFDDLMEKVQGIPQAAQAVPVLALMKGLGKTVDDKLIWNITYTDGKLLVNNVDVMKMAGGGGAPAPRNGGPSAGKPTPNKR